MNVDKNKKEVFLKNKIDDQEFDRMLSNHAYWESNADKYSSSNSVSWGDLNAMDLEIRNISKYIKNGDLVLDAGCSNGFSTFEISRQKDIKVKAFDYSPKAIAIAKKEQQEKDPKGKISFSCGNILNINEESETFDAAYSIRVVINLPTWERQKEAILEMHRILKKGGLYLMSEAFSGSLNNINALRQAAGLKPLTVHEFNLYLEEEKLEEFLKEYFEIVKISKFSSIYYVASRFLRYLTMSSGDKDTFDNEINNMFSKYQETENSGDFGIQKLYVLKKR